MDERIIRATAREKLRGSWGRSVLAGLTAYWLGGLIASSGSINLNLYEDILPDVLSPRLLTLVLGGFLLIAVINVIIGGTVQLGYAKFLLSQQDGREYAVGDLFSQFHRFGTGFAQAFLRMLYVLLWTLLLIIPGIVKGFSYAMTPFILMDHPEMTASEAIRASQKLMEGHKGDLFVLSLSFIGWNLLCVLTLGIASLWVNPYINAAYAAFYRELTAQQREAYAEF